MKKILFFFLLVITCPTTFAQTGLKRGDVAPQFSGIDNYGKSIDLSGLLATHKYVVLFFYRGQWCSYCNRHLKDLQDSLQTLMAKDAFIVGVTPETKENLGKTVQKTKATFSLISDEGYTIMKAYKVNFTVDETMLSKLKGYGVDLEANNGNKDHVLPVPATYVIDRNSKIVFAQFNKDYTKRPSVREIAQSMQ